jgi:hypothetical protein
LEWKEFQFRLNTTHNFSKIHISPTASSSFSLAIAWRKRAVQRIPCKEALKVRLKDGKDQLITEVLSCLFVQALTISALRSRRQGPVLRERAFVSDDLTVARPHLLIEAHTTQVSKLRAEKIRGLERDEKGERERARAVRSKAKERGQKDSALLTHQLDSFRSADARTARIPRRAEPEVMMMKKGSNQRKRHASHIVR